MPRRHPAPVPTYLVAVDFSECSRQVLDVAIEQCRHAGAKMLLVHAFRPGIKLGMLYQDGALDPIHELEAEMQLDEAVELTTKWAKLARDAGVAVETVAEAQAASSLILDAARDHDADMIIMGRSGHGMLHKLFIGSTADQVVRESKCPVLVVPEKK